MFHWSVTALISKSSININIDRDYTQNDDDSSNDTATTINTTAIAC